MGRSLSWFSNDKSKLELSEVMSMGLTVEKAFFANLGDVLDDVKSNSTWPTTFVSGPSKGLPEHWHDYEVHAYVMEGETWFMDSDTGERLDVVKGDKVIIPEGFAR